MHHVFIINPAAGKEQRALNLLPEIQAFFAQHPGDYVVYVTQGPQDATRFVREWAEKQLPTRFYACGGDGTLMEVLNGAFGCDHCEIACVPCGSANDYVRSFSNSSPFLSIADQINGAATPVDAIDCNGKISLNICTIGMDADVGAKMADFKHLPLVTGPMAYNLAVVYMFFHRIGRQLRVRMETLDGEVACEGNYLFSLAANGQYYGGGYRGAPQARLNDGMLDFVLIDTIKRYSVLGFLKKYKAGNHLDMPIVHTYRGYRMHVTANEPLTVCVDGECFADRQVTFAILPQAVKFVLPVGVTV